MFHKFLTIAATSILLACAGCDGAAPLADGTDYADPGIHWPEPDVGMFLAGEAKPIDDFESGDLADWGAPGQTVVSEIKFGIAQNVLEGTSFSTRSGEERIDLHGQRALALQVTVDDGSGWAQITSDPFLPAAPHLLFSQLSEVDDRGVELGIEVLDLDDALSTATYYEIPVVTGGHRPGLASWDEPIEGCPEIGDDMGYPGVPVFQAIDISEPFLRGHRVQVRFVQRSTVAPFDFFTLIDDVGVVEIPAAYEEFVPVIEPIAPF